MSNELHKFSTFKLKYLWLLMKGRVILHIGPFIFWWVCVYCLYILTYSGNLFIHLYQCMSIWTKLVLYWIVLKIYLKYHLFSYCLWLYFMLSNKHLFPYEFCLLRTKVSVLEKVPNVQGSMGHLGRVLQLTCGPITFALRSMVQLSPNVLICREKGVSRQCYPHSPTCCQD